MYFFIVLFFKGYYDFAEFTHTNRGNPKLIHNQFFYNKSADANSHGIVTWRCALSHSFPKLKCKAKALTQVIGGYEMVKITGQHTHTSNYKKKKWQKRTDK